MESNMFKEISDIAAKWVAIIAAIIGGWIGLQQYTANTGKTLDDRQREVLRFSERFSSDILLRARLQVFKMTRIADNAMYGDRDISVNWALVNELLSDENTLPHTKHSKIVGGLLVQNNRGEVLAIVDFFNALAACVRANLCDREAAYLFSPTAREYRGYLFWAFRGPEQRLLESLEIIENTGKGALPWRKPRKRRLLLCRDTPRVCPFEFCTRSA
jgi:hypothetical protein